MVEYQLIGVEGIKEFDVPFATRAMIVSERIISGCSNSG